MQLYHRIRLLRMEPIPQRIRLQIQHLIKQYQVTKHQMRQTMLRHKPIKPKMLQVIRPIFQMLLRTQPITNRSLRIRHKT